MRIGIDARFYNKETAGIGRVIREFLSQVIKLDKKNTYIVFLSPEDIKDFDHKAPNIEVVPTRARYYSLAEHVIFPIEIWRARVDFVHFMNFNVPMFCPVPYIVTIHDLTLFFFPGRKKKTWIYQYAYRLVIGNAVRRARVIHAITKHTKSDIMKAFGVPSKKIRVIYEGVDSFVTSKTKRGESKTLEKLGIANPFFMYHGAWRKHKNLETLLIAFKQFISTNEESYILVLAGKIDPAYPEVPKLIEALGLDSRVVLTGFLEDADLRVLLRKCKVYVFPSLYEGFGLTPLEAMACGAPVISSKASCMPEVLADSVYYFDPKDPGDLYAAMQKVTSDSELRDELSSKGLVQIRRYSWAKMVRELLTLYKSMYN